MVQHQRCEWVTEGKGFPEWYRTKDVNGSLKVRTEKGEGTLTVHLAQKSHALTNHGIPSFTRVFRIA